LKAAVVMTRIVGGGPAEKHAPPAAELELTIFPGTDQERISHAVESTSQGSRTLALVLLLAGETVDAATTRTPVGRASVLAWFFSMIWDGLGRA